MVKIKVDLGNREKLRRLHTVTHIINFSARKVLGNHIWQNGSNLKANEGTLDITHFDNLTQNEIFEIEKLANETIFENKKVSVEELDRTQAEQKYGFSLYQGGAIPMKTLRVVKILDSDIEACGGIHMQETGGIGLVKIIESSKIQDGVVRLKYVVRDFALDYINKKQETLKNVSQIFQVQESHLIGTSEKFFKEWKEQKKEIENLKSKLKINYINTILKSNSNEYDLKEDYDMAFLMDIFNQVNLEKKSFKLISTKFIIATTGILVENSKKEIKKGKFSIFVM